MAESLEPYYECRGEIRPGKPGTTKFGKNMKETLGIVEERIEENSYHETIGKFKNIPPHFRPEYYHSGNIIEQKEKQNDN